MLATRHPEGVLSVTIYEAKDLKDQDMIGKNDPFIELWVDENHKQRTSEAKNTNNPVYNETFAFTVRQGVKHKLYLKVKDKDILGTDKIGEAKIDLQDVFNGSVFDDWINLPAMLGLSSHGKVHLRVEFVPTEELPTTTTTKA
ncbi:hypothetical protein O0I10_001655 [Lichtheimia ornata]|uniref:C2 domain-containing protein n=1 Tax=Lichtheimia ornata TaxID=688661 RepID=A0AAD7Y285_9FUNG|nr:uncharacterized protein O0I10_001655 [Lichtheimia ornata]KAJ8662691.1 hypothetical protein O0I10_001655 [Lichtheimia ornata]